MLNNLHLGTIASENAERFGDKIAFYHKDSKSGSWLPITWRETNEQVVRMAHAFLAYGLKPGDKVGIFSQNMVEIIVVDLALQAIRCVSVPMYATQSAEQVDYIVKDANIEIIFTGEQYQFDETVKVIANNSILKKVVGISPAIDFKGLAQAVRYDEFLKLGDGKPELHTEYENRQKQLNLEDLSILIYTSGTTGEPKGVMLTAGNASQALKIHKQRMISVLSKGCTSMSFLPLSHIFERGWTYMCMMSQMPVYVNTNPKEIQKTLKEVRPNCMCAVPRFWEKVYSGVHEKLDSFPGIIRKFANHAIEVGKEYNLGHLMVNKKPSAWLTLRYKFYDKTLFHMLRKAVGVDKGVMFPVAGAACSERVNAFMHSVGINFVVGYGLTETFATVSCYPVENGGYVLESAGELMDGYEAKIDPTNNEILLKSPTITPGYYNKPEANRETFTEDGFFRTGDAGRIIEGGRYPQIVIVERIKELFKTSNGKYIAPQQIEMLLDGDKYIDQSCVIADGRKYVTALLVPEYKQVEDFAAENGITYNSREELLANAKVNELFTQHVKEAVAKLAAYEQVKYFALLPEPFNMDKGELTNTLKMKRKVINQHFADKIEAMYQN
ncbi:MAG: long-chain fatty acid--CoA ligase [Paludibacteraceae bacterium]|nr:long-chain fatty acid--CoA ligase [Paludibacteraceae bacterium]